MTTLMIRAHARALVASVAIALAACATNPVTGKSELSLVSEEQEIQLGQSGAQDVAQSIGLLDDQALQQYVQNLGASLARDSERPNLPWTFRVVDDPTPNAFAFPGGFIFVTRGMLTHMNSEADLASVLGHEIGHVTAKHTVQQISRAQLAQLGLGIGMILSERLREYGDLASTGLSLLFLKYGRDAERQADDLGFRYTLEHGYDVREMVSVFATLARLGEASGQSPLPAWLATHPYPEERIQATQQRLAQLSQQTNNLRANQEAFMTRVNGLVYGANPRHGFFRGTTFLHPDLRFRLDFPNGWSTQNLAQAVVAVSPQRDAAIQLTLANAQSSTAAAQRFVSQQGIVAQQPTRENVNGLPAVASYFEAQTEQGVVRGLAAFVEHGGRTFQLLAYSPAAAYSAYDAAVRRALGSFSPVSDPAVLSVQPNRLVAVRIDQPMTLAQFNQRFPSAIPIEELAIVNELASPDAVIPGGTILKRVVAGSG